MLDRRGVERFADGREESLALVAVVRVRAHLDEFVRGERDVDLVEHGRREAGVADRHDRVERMRARAKLAPHGRSEGEHRPSVSCRPCPRP